MSCDTGYPGTDPASLRPSLTRRIPGATGAADEFLREAATEFFRRSGVWRDHTLTLEPPTTLSQQNFSDDLILGDKGDPVTGNTANQYDLPTPAIGRIVRIVHVWMPSSTGEHKMQHDTEVRNAIDGVQRWHTPNPRTIEFHKQLDPQVTLRLDAVLTLDSNNRADEFLIEEHREAIIAGASYYATMSQDKETSNRTAGIDYYSIFNDAIADASSKYQQKFAVERQPMSRMKALQS